MGSGKKKAKRIIIIVIASLMAAVFVIMPAISLLIYNSVFGGRFMTAPSMFSSVDDFPGLKRERYTVISNEGQKLAAYHYFREGQEVKGIVIMSHGFGGGGHNGYMHCADFLTKNGYYVFAYDVTGNDASEGEGTNGTPQGVIDLDYAISFVEESGNFPDLPIGLIGHSWGAYSVSNVLTFHPEVKAVIECCGFNRSSDMFESGGISQAGSLIYAMTPCVRIYEMFKFGKYATNTAMDAFDATDAHIMCVHSEDDDVILIGYGYDKYYENWSWFCKSSW